MWRTVMTGLLCLGLGVGLLQAEDGAEEPGVRIVPPPEVVPNHTKIRNATLQQVLRRRVSVNAIETPLNDLLEFLRNKSGVNAINLDRPALEAESIDVAAPVTLQADEVTLGQALHRILEPINLKWVVKDSGFLITTGEGASKLTTRVTPVGRIVDAVEADPQQRAKSEAGLGGDDGEHPLVHAIHRAAGGPWAAIDGAGGSVLLNGKTLTVRGTARDHEEVDVLLSAIQLWRDGRLKHGSAVLHSQWSPAEDDARIAAALAQKKEEIVFDGTPLKDAIQFLNDTSGIRILLDEHSLNAESIDASVAVRQSGRDMTLQAALDMILEPLSLTAVIDHGFLMVMTTAKAEQRRRTVIYDVRDLVPRIPTAVLTQLIQGDSTIAWGETAGEGSVVSPLRGCLIVRHADSVHRKVAQLLEGLRAAHEPGDDKQSAEPDPEAPEQIETRFYPILREGAASQIQAAIIDLVAPESWNAAGGKGVVHVVEETLVVRQTRKVHREIGAFLKALKSAEETASP